MSSQVNQMGSNRWAWISWSLAAGSDHMTRPARDGGRQRARRRRRVAPELLWLEDRRLLSTVNATSTTSTPTVNKAVPTVADYEGADTSGTNLGSTAPTPVGTYTVVLTYGGTFTVTPIGIATYTEAQAAPITPDVSLSASTGSAVYGQSITFVATVSAPFRVATGTFTFSDGGTTLGVVNLNAAGQATLTTSALAIGSHSITASYSGDADDQGVTTTPVVESVVQANTQVVLVPQPGFKKKKLVSLSLKAEVKPIAPGGGVPSGTLTFEVKTKSKKTPEKMLGIATLNSDGTATLAVKPKSVLNEPITLVYSGDVDFASSTSSPTTLTQEGLESLARPMLSLQLRGHRRTEAGLTIGRHPPG
jgi:hypothetical protein